MGRITIVSEGDAISAQARAYAEYRVFAALARSGGNVRRVRVVLRQIDADGHRRGRASCAVTVTLAPAGVLRIRATAPHPYAGIDRAVDRLAHALGRRRVETRAAPGEVHHHGR